MTKGFKYELGPIYAYQMSIISQFFRSLVLQIWLWHLRVKDHVVVGLDV